MLLNKLNYLGLLISSTQNQADVPLCGWEGKVPQIHRKSAAKGPQILHVVSKPSVWRDGWASGFVAGWFFEDINEPRD